MNKRLFDFDLVQMSIFMLIVAILHIVLLLKILQPIYTEVAPWKIYLLLIPMSLFGLLYIKKSHKKDETSVVKTFMFYTVVKIFASLIFLFPWLYHKDETSFIMVAQFFGVFFPILFAETLFLIKMLNKSSDNLRKN